MRTCGLLATRWSSIRSRRGAAGPAHSAGGPEYVTSGWCGSRMANPDLSGHCPPNAANHAKVSTTNTTIAAKHESIRVCLAQISLVAARVVSGQERCRRHESAADQDRDQYENTYRVPRPFRAPLEKGVCIFGRAHIRAAGCVQISPTDMCLLSDAPTARAARRCAPRRAPKRPQGISPRPRRGTGAARVLPVPVPGRVRLGRAHDSTPAIRITIVRSALANSRPEYGSSSASLRH